MTKKSILALAASALLLASCGQNNTPPITSSVSSVESSVTSSTTSSESNEDEISRFTEITDEDGNKAYELKSVFASSLEEYEVPSEYNGYPVISISQTAFTSAKKLKKLTIPNSIKSMPAGVFSGLGGTIVELITPFIGTSRNDAAPDSSSVRNTANLGSMFNYLTGNYTPSFAPNLTKISITDQPNIPRSALYAASTITSLTVTGAVNIGSYAFADLTALTSLSLNEGILSLGAGSLSGNTALTELNLPSTIKKIDSQALRALTIDTLNLPADLEEITFYNDMPNLKSITIAESNTNFVTENGILYSKDKTKIYCYPVAKEGTSFSLPNTVTTIGLYCFAETKITSIDLSNVSIIEGEAFYMSSLTEVIFGTKLTKIGLQAFSYSDKLVTINFSETIEGEFAFEGSMQFVQCTSLTSVHLPSWIKDIPSSMFASCTKLAEIRIDGTLNSIGNLAFNKTIISSISTTFANKASIGSNVFGETNLSTWYVHFADDVETYPALASTGIGASPAIYADSDAITLALKDAWKSLSSLIGIDPSQVFITDDDGILTSYRPGESTDQTVVNIPEGVTGIAKNAFAGNTEIKYVKVPSSVTNIASGAFGGNTSLMAVEFAHEDASTVTFGSNIYSALGENPKVRLLVSDTTSIKELSKVTGTLLEADNILRASNAQVDTDNDTIWNSDKSEILAYLGNATSYTIPAGVKTIGIRAFEHSKLETIDFGEELITIKDHAFSTVTTMTSLSFPKSLTSIEEGAFSGCWDLESIVFNDSPCAIGANAFSSIGENNSLVELKLGNAITSIGSNAFCEARAGVEMDLVIPKTAYIASTDAFDTAFDYEDSRLLFAATIEEFTTLEDGAVSPGDFYNDYSLNEYYYSETEPTESGDGYGFWHYNSDNGVEIW